MANKNETNEQFVKRLMNINPTGPLCQAFIIEAISRYAKQIAELIPEKIAELDQMSPMIHMPTWQRCAKHIHTECETKYNKL